MPKGQQEVVPKEEDVVQGGPGEENPDEGVESTQNAGAAVKVKIGDQEFELPADVAAALQKHTEDSDSQLELLKAMATRSQPVQQTAQTQDEEYDFDTGIFTEPGIALAKLEDRILKKVTAAYTAEQERQGFWTTFYKENADLKEMDFLVESVLSKNYATLKDMQADKAMKKLADLTKAAADKILPKRDKGTTAQNRAIVEGASTPAIKNSGQQEKPEILSLSAIIRARQAAKRGGKAA